ncbi:hypothetical protein [Phenylobacterium sp.]|jgi:hypothetical protein|uniref:hypothetical protein n=1 Tax=Phenylobacterium sp. TaxID=1871053 RepID=UPI002F410408
MVPIAEHDVGVRFARGNAAMVSTGEFGSVVLLPIRYNSTNKLRFSVAAFNTSGRPVNFGTEDIRIRLRSGDYLPVQDFDYLRQEARIEAEREITAAWVSAGIEGLLAYQENEGRLNRTAIAYRRATGDLAASTAYIEAKLFGTVREHGRTVLQTTTIDPGTAYGGAIFADQISVPPGSVDAIDVEVRFGGELHQFRIAIAPSGTASPVLAGIPAVTQREMRSIQNTPQTWMWDRPASETKYQYRGRGDLER